MALKRLLNRYEEKTNARLQEVCGPHGVHIYVKVRLSDVVSIERSGISDIEFSYALRAHLDFLVVDGNFDPLFAIEFDGPRHQEEEQAHRDVLKNQICKRFNLPLIRIDTRYIEPRYTDMDLLSWLVSVVIARRESRRMFDDGQLTYEELAVDPTFCAPFVISYPARETLIQLAERGICSRYPPFIIGSDSDGNAHGLGAVWLASNSLAVTSADMPYQGFLWLAEDLLEELLYIKLVQTTEAVISGKGQAWDFPAFHDAVKDFLSCYSCRHSFLIDPRNGQISRLGS